MRTAVQPGDCDGGPPRRRARGWLAAAAVWTAAAVLFAVVLRVQLGVPFLYGLQSAAVEYYILGALMAGVWALNERRRLPRRGAAAVAAHLLLGLLVIALWKGAEALFLRLALGPSFWHQVYAASWSFQLLAAVTTYGTALGVVLALQSARREREQERRAAAAELGAREAELQSLKGRLQPHFLMNALNSVVALLDDEPERARAVLFRLADVLHAGFERLDDELVPLAAELDFVAAYLEIEQVRLGDRLRWRRMVSDAVATVQIPPFLLQPLVENAVKHGIAPFARGGEVEVAAWQEDGRLTVAVSDTGPGFDPGGDLEQGHGLEITRRRLHALYGEEGRLSLGRRGGRFTVQVDLPLDPALRSSILDVIRVPRSRSG